MLAGSGSSRAANRNVVDEVRTIQLFGLEPNDPITLTIATTVMAGVALLAGYIPAERGAGIQSWLSDMSSAYYIRYASRYSLRGSVCSFAETASFRITPRSKRICLRSVPSNGARCHGSPKAPAKENARPLSRFTAAVGWAVPRQAFLERVLPWVQAGFVRVNADCQVAGVARLRRPQRRLKAAEWFRKNSKRWNVDPKRIVVTGGSAGGHLALVVGLAPKSALGAQGEIAA